MVSITCGNNVTRATKVFSESTTVREVCAASGVDCSRGSMHLDGTMLGAADIDKTLAQVGAKNGSFLLNVAKADNA